MVFHSPVWRTSGPWPIQQLSNIREKLVHVSSSRAARGLVPLFHKIHTPYYYGCIVVCYNTPFSRFERKERSK